jgi:hypothetical protein
MVGTSGKGTSHILRVFDLTYFSRLQRSKFVHAHLDDAYAITQKTFDIYLIFGVWVGHVVEQFPIENRPAVILLNCHAFTVQLSHLTVMACSR